MRKRGATADSGVMELFDGHSALAVLLAPFRISFLLCVSIPSSLRLHFANFSFFLPFFFTGDYDALSAEKMCLVWMQGDLGKQFWPQLQGWAGIGSCELSEHELRMLRDLHR
jgi:hypothetical protein